MNIDKIMPRIRRPRGKLRYVWYVLIFVLLVGCSAGTFEAGDTLCDMKTGKQLIVAKNSNLRPVSGSERIEVVRTSQSCKFHE